MYFVFVIKIRRKSVSRDNVKTLETGKEMSLFYLYEIILVRLPHHAVQYDARKYREEVDADPSRGINDGF